ncbi:threonylcarbamoyl-AMP synthase-like [Physella acuta]|uniref:threonylcarbamoyl-AMP synthase-like n=1 Tax=Physella acuta TaxID=109671 RepID=UPI0027DBA20A|nr:threonylcarbamoyl-AMP synthase-like [Physella acuta]
MEKLHIFIFALNKFLNSNSKLPFLTTAALKLLKSYQCPYSIDYACVQYRHRRKFLKCSSLNLKPHHNSCRNSFLQHYSLKNPAALFNNNSLQFSANTSMTPIVENQADLKTGKPHTLFCYVYNNSDGVLNPAVCTRHTENESHYTKPDFKDVIQRSTACLLSGGVVAVPTDTIYGIAGLAQNVDAVNRIYEIKKRNFQNPVAISVATIDDIYRWGKVNIPKQILTELLPGPVTVVFERSPDLNPLLNPNTNLVGIRIPKNDFMQELVKQCNGPIALTSANISGAKSCLEIEEFKNLWNSLDLIVDGGKINDTEESRLGSTVVDLSVSGKFRIIRPGSAYQATSSCLRRFGLQEVKDVTVSER